MYILQYSVRRRRFMRRSPLFFVLIILGVLLVLIGIGFGAGSHSSTYKQVSQDAIKHYISDGTTGYLQMASSPDLYVINEGDFSPKMNGTQTLQDNDIISFVVDPTDTTNIDSRSNMGTHLVGTGENVVEIALELTTVGSSGGQTTEFATAAYRANAQGYTQNNWGGAAAIIVLGLLLAIGSFFLPRRKPQGGFGITPVGQPMVNPYQQPNQGFAPYPGPASYNQQQPPYPQYPPTPYPQQPVQPPTAYGQPANPYGQP
jgi:hypothetical protein